MSVFNEFSTLVFRLHFKVMTVHSYTIRSINSFLLHFTSIHCESVARLHYKITKEIYISLNWGKETENNQTLEMYLNAFNFDTLTVFKSKVYHISIYLFAESVIETSRQSYV